MVTPTLLADGVAALAIAAVYAYIARLFAQRPIEHQDARLAGFAFTTWWGSIAVTTALGATRHILAGLGLLTLEMHVAIGVLTLPFLCLALWGLVYYLLYIHSGSRKWLVPVTIFHALLFALFAYLTAWLDPTRVDALAWRVEANNARTLSGPLLWGVILAILAPAILAAVMYGSLFFRTRDPTARYRIGLVSLAFVLWFGTALLAAAIRLQDAIPAWPLIARLIGLASALAVVAAYRPPAAIRRRLRAGEGLP